jgi:uncharacterized protein DUF3891
MLVRDAGSAWHIVLQTEHGELAGKFAQEWSPRPEPFASLHTVARRHDDGWFVWERGPTLDPEGRPANFLDVPVRLHLAFYKAAIAAVTTEDPYAGVILSLHGAGIYKQRYGLQSDLRMRFVDDAAGDARAFIAEQEEGLPGRLEELGIGESEAWRGYHFLQVWDRLSLHACLSDLEAAGATDTIPAVPSQNGDGELTLTTLGGGRVQVDPWPFGSAPLELSFERRVIPKETWADDVAFRESFFASPTEHAVITLEPGPS